jgi:hypothetical protein
MFAVYTLAKYTLKNIAERASITYYKNTLLKQLVYAKCRIPTHPEQLLKLKIQQFIKAIRLKEAI